MTIKYLDSKRVSGLAPVSYTTQSAYDTTGTTYGAESNVSASTTRRGIKILTGSSAIGKVIRKVSTKMRGVSSPTGNLTFKVYRSGSAISTSNTLDVSTLTSSFVLKELLLDTKVTLQADDRVVAEYTDATGSMAVHFLYNNSPSTIASGFNHTSWNGSAWSDITYDIMFAFDSTPASYIDTSGDTKPTNVQDNSIFVETDTARRYWFEPPTGVAYDINGATVTSQSKLLFSTLETPAGVVFKSDGTEMFLGDRNSTRGGVSQWTLSTAWDVSTATLTGSVFNPSTQLGDRVVSGISLNPTGTIMYLTGRTNNKIYQYTLSTAWDLSTVSYASKTLDNSSQTTNAYAGQISSDGTKFYIGFVASPPDEILQYNLSTAWDISTASYSQSFTLTGGSGYTIGLQFLSDGTKFINQAGSSFEQYSMSTAWDISTASYDNVSVSQSAESYAYPVSWGNDGKSIYSVEGTLVSGDVNPTIHKYDVPLTGTWIMEPTYEDDWASTPSGQTIVGSQVTESSNRINYAFTLNNAANSYSLDLANASNMGANLDDEKFVVRFKMYIQDLTSNATARFVMMLSDTANAEPAVTSQNSLGFYTDGRSGNDEFFPSEYTGTTITSGSEITSMNGTGINQTNYVEFKRESQTVFRVTFYSDSTYSTVVGTSQTVTAKSTHDALRYFSIGIRQVSGKVADIEGYIDDLKIYNGVTSIN